MDTQRYLLRAGPRSGIRDLVDPMALVMMRLLSMPSAEFGGEARRNRALNCWPWVQSFTHWPEAVIHSPAAMVAAWPTTVTTSRWPRALARKTQKPFSTMDWTGPAIPEDRRRRRLSR